MAKVKLCLEKGLFARIALPSGEFTLQRGGCIEVEESELDVIEKELKAGIFYIERSIDKNEEPEEEEVTQEEVSTDEADNEEETQEGSVEEGVKEDEGTSEVAAEKLNLNTVTLEQLIDVPGIGEDLAIMIVNYREKNGGFKSVDELENIKGIGAKKLESLRDWFTV